MATLKQIRQRLRDYTLARRDRVHAEVDAAFAHVLTAVDDLTEIIEAEGPPVVVDPPDPPDPGPAYPDGVTPAQGAALARIFGVPAFSVVPEKYDALWRRWEAHHDALEHKWELGYYDRPFAYYAAWWRTGEAAFRDRGDEWLLLYRDGYILPNSGRVPPEWVLPEGLAIHHLLHDDPDSLRAIDLFATYMGSWIDHAPNDSILRTNYRDGRIQGRAWLCQIIAHELGAGDRLEMAKLALTDMLAWYDVSGDGRWDSSALPSSGRSADQMSYMGGMAIFQICHGILDAFVRHHDLLEPVDRIDEVLTATLDFVWRHWSATKGFRYVIPAAGQPVPEDWDAKQGKDVTLLCATAFAHAYRLTGQQRFKDRADEIFALGVSGSLDFPFVFMSGYKQFNQSFFRAWRHLLAGP